MIKDWAMSHMMMGNMHKRMLAALMLAACFVVSSDVVQAAGNASTKYVMVPKHRSTLVTLKTDMSEVMVADPEIADVHAHNANNLSIVGKKLGRTNVRVFGKDGKLQREIYVTVGYDLPAMRRALKNFIPDERIGVEMVNTSVALTGHVRSAEAAEKAIKIVKDFLGSDPAKTHMNDEDLAKNGDAEILNMLKVTAGQQVMLKVRVGEINREALKNLSIDLSAVDLNGSGSVLFGTGAGVPAFFSPLDGSEVRSPGSFIIPDPLTATNPPHGVFSARYADSNYSLGGMIQALERDGLFKLLAEPNLVAISGEEAEFLAGGEIPIPVVQNTSGSTPNISIEYKPFGVAIRFTPFVLSENRIRMAVQPEVSEISDQNAVIISGFSIPSINTRRARTTVELSPGESFMIAGLIKDELTAQVDQLPGAKELPVLGALFRSSSFQRNETELVIAVTPYVVDPMKSADVKLPTDNFRPASQMETFFYGALGSLAGRTTSQSPGLEGPVGFMVD